MARLRYLGISFFEIVTDEGKVVYVDPCISLNKYCPITLDDITHADLVAVSHRARDHANDVIPLLERTGAAMICTRDLHYVAKRAGIPESRISRVQSGVFLERAGVRVRALKTEHGSFSEFEGQPLFDNSVGYIIYVRGSTGIYHMGDTSIFSDLQLFGRLYRPKVMLTPIGMGIWPDAVVTMDPREAAIATGMIGPDIVVPMHYDQVAQADALESFGRHLKEEAPNTQLKVLQAGDYLEV